jgi:hypothetical protein
LGNKSPKFLVEAWSVLKRGIIDENAHVTLSTLVLVTLGVHFEVLLFYNISHAATKDSETGVRQLEIARKVPAWTIFL